MDTIKLENGFLVPSLNNTNQWFFFGNDNKEVEVIRRRTIAGTVYNYNTNLHWKEKDEIQKSIRGNEQFGVSKEEWQKIQDNGNHKYRVA